MDLTSANDCYYKGCYAEAFQLYQEASLSSSSTILEKDKIYYNMGMCSINLKNYKLAIELFKEAIKISVNSCNNYVWNSKTITSINNHRFIQYYYNLGYTYSLINEFEEAYKCFAKIKDMDSLDSYIAEPALLIMSNIIGIKGRKYVD